MEPRLHPVPFYFVLKTCTPAWRLNDPAIPFYELVFILEGGAKYHINGTPYSVRAGEVLFLESQSSRSAVTGGMSCAAVDFLLEAGEELRLPIHLAPGPLQWERLLKNLREFNFEWLQKRPGSEMKCQALLLLILHELIFGSPEGIRNPHVERLKRQIVERSHEKLTVRQLAQECGLSPVYCGALFKRYEGCTISVYINRVRIRKAAALLETGEYQVGEAARLAGFCDIYYFSTVFKKIMGCSPTAYRTHGYGKREPASAFFTQQSP